MSDQRREAWSRAQEVKQRRAEIRRQLKAGETYAHCVIDDDSLKNAFVREVLLWQKGFGVKKVGACLAAMGAFNPRCPDLTEEQRAIMSYYCTWEGKGERAIPPKPPTARPHPYDEHP